MARSKHTRPKSIIAADRTREPDGKRDDRDLSGERKLLRVLKELGLHNEPNLNNCEKSALRPNEVDGLPRIRMQRPRSGFIHPARREDIRSILLYFGELSWYGVREICLAQSQASQEHDKLLFGGLSVPGKLLLYEQPKPPWFLSGKLPDDQLEAIKSAGGTVEVSSDGSRCKINWTDEALRDFMLFEVLMHEIGHHIIQHFKGKREAQVLRTKDHEASAHTFARRCREEYLQWRVSK